MKILFLLIFICSSLFSAAQTNTPTKLKVFIDCRINCDENYIRSEINFIDFVLDRKAADVHILITSRANGSGGSNVQFIFYGQNNFKSRTDTLIYNQSPTATNNEIRTQITKRIRLGILPFLTKASNIGLVNVEKEVIDEIKKDTIKISPTPKKIAVQTQDNWNYWVYKIGLDGKYNADENYRNSAVSGYLSANRTTDKSRINFSVYANNDISIYNYEDSGVITKYKVVNNNYQLTHYLIKSISDHWSVGYETSYSSSTFSNNKSRIYLSPGIEYAVFPYAQVNNKFLTVSYNLGIRHNKYYDSTIYDKTSEFLLGQKIYAKLSLNQKWGYVNTSITYSNYFMDWKLNNLSLNLEVNVRVTGGLSFYIYSYGGLVHDQIYLAKGNTTLQEVLTRRRQLASGYNFYTSVGISYRFGSILNNFVNPRFSNY